MPESYRFAYRGGEGEIIEKKSRFIATVSPISSEEEALRFIEQTKKKYWDARHNCTAFTLGDRHQLTRCSDDGEPAGTAGRPMLEVLLKEDIHDIAVVVTRYFGGTLLGTGGLVRAYSGAVQEGLAHSVILEKQIGIPLVIGCSYEDLGRIQYLIGQRCLPTLDSTYTDQVSLKVLSPAAAIGELCDALTEASAGRARLEQLEPCSYALCDGAVKIFAEENS